MIAVLYIRPVRFSEAIIVRHLGLSQLRCAFTLDMWAYVVGLKKKVAEANKIMKLGFPNYSLT